MWIPVVFTVVIAYVAWCVWDEKRRNKRIRTMATGISTMSRKDSRDLMRIEKETVQEFKDKRAAVKAERKRIKGMDTDEFTSHVYEDILKWGK